MARKSSALWYLIGAAGALYLYQRSTVASAPSAIPAQSGDWVQDPGTGRWYNFTTGEWRDAPPAPPSYYPPGSLQNVYL